MAKYMTPAVCRRKYRWLPGVKHALVIAGIWLCFRAGLVHPGLAAAVAGWEALGLGFHLGRMT